MSFEADLIFWKSCRLEMYLRLVVLSASVGFSEMHHEGHLMTPVMYWLQIKRIAYYQVCRVWQSAFAVFETSFPCDWHDRSGLDSHPDCYWISSLLTVNCSSRIYSICCLNKSSGCYLLPQITIDVRIAAVFAAETYRKSMDMRFATIDSDCLFLYRSMGLFSGLLMFSL